VVFADQLDLSKHCVDGHEQSHYHYHYALYAIVVHYGAALWSGHYAALVKGDDGWRCYDDERVTRLPNVSVALQQDPYLLFYERVASPAAPIVASSVNNNSNNVSAAVIPSILRSSVSVAVDPGVVFVRLEFNEPLSPSLSAMLRVRISPSGGFISLCIASSSSSAVPLLRYAVPLSLAYEFSEARAEGPQLVIRLPLALQAKDVKTEIEDTEVEVKSLPVSEILTDSEDADELDIVPQLNADQRLAAAQAAVQRANVARGEASYSNLYSQIDAAWQRSQSSPEQVARSYVPPPNVAVGRNELCPCCSGKKFKQCHGSASISKKL
jgi:hypothetical protein